MSIFTQLERACLDNGIKEITFIRISYFEKSTLQITDMKEKAIMLVEQLSHKELTEFHELMNQQTLLISGKLSKKGLFNISVAATEVQQPVLKVEIIGDQSMIQLDTSTESAFGGTYYKSLLNEFY